MNWSVYIILCSDGSLYTGISTDVKRRFQQHRAGKGAKYFRSRQPQKIVFLETGHCHASAAQLEMQIKKMKRSDKASLIAARQAEIEE
jgi:putative endonuclease